ncbi:MAG TPA: sigma factor-like helix-turn-helix DNA-binding protein [Propionibacteriaceae bacterium]|nr:sigma factor-like helix-turn-helix DNA-binding protein [Propionibacteriaceae bacterium]
MAPMRDDEFAAVVERERPLLQGIAYLLTGDAERADRLVQAVWARMYENRVQVTRPRVEAIRALIVAEPLPLNLPWESAPRFELVDGQQLTAGATEPIVADLRRLTADQRTAIILERYAQLPSAQIAEVLGRPIDEVLVLARQARAALAMGHPQRVDDTALARELEDAIPVDHRTAHGSADDLAHGRRLVRQRRLRRGAAALAAALVLVVGFAVLLPDRVPPPSAAPPAAGDTAGGDDPPVPPRNSVSPVPAVVTPTSPTCSPAESWCRGRILFRWRSEMAEVVQSHLDPGGVYFSGFGYRYDGRYDSPDFWSGQGGALAFEMFRLDRGATVVYVQIATSRQTAVRCGATTGHECQTVRFMNGNQMRLSLSNTVAEGVEVQYRPSGQVITVVARNTARGKTFPLTSAELVELVQDPRLQLPKF